MQVLIQIICILAPIICLIGGYIIGSIRKIMKETSNIVATINVVEQEDSDEPLVFLGLTNGLEDLSKCDIGRVQIKHTRASSQKKQSL